MSASCRRICFCRDAPTRSQITVTKMQIVRLYIYIYIYIYINAICSFLLSLFILSCILFHFFCFIFVPYFNHICWYKYFWVPVREGEGGGGVGFNYPLSLKFRDIYLIPRFKEAFIIFISLKLSQLVSYACIFFQLYLIPKPLTGPPFVMYTR